jgi:hypothetical protein
MLIFNEHSKPELIENIYGPTLSDYFWALDLNVDGDGEIDYTLAPIVMFEETTCPSLILRMNGFTFNLPAKWNILIFDEETSEIDVVTAEDLSGNNFTAFVYGDDAPTVELGHITVVGYEPNHINVAPALNKNQMLCHPISPTRWINVAPTDTYNKYLKGS